MGSDYVQLDLTADECKALSWAMKRVIAEMSTKIAQHELILDYPADMMVAKETLKTLKDIKTMLYKEIISEN